MAAHCIQHPDLKYRRSFAQSGLSIGRSRRLLSPAYDLNPVPTDIKPRVLTTAIDLDDGTASLKLALEVAAYFELGTGEVRQIAAEVGQAVARWRKVAAKLGLTSGEIDRMASAFEHEDLKAARSLSDSNTARPERSYEFIPTTFCQAPDSSAGEKPA